MENQNTENTERNTPQFGSLKNSVSLKLVIITVLILLLLIPATMIKSLIEEREKMNQQALEEVHMKWAGQQLIKGPVLSIPYEYETVENGVVSLVRSEWHILPEDLNVNGKIEPKILELGIFEIVVYDSDLNVDGSFLLNKKLANNTVKNIFWDQAFLTIGVSDLRGIEEEIDLRWNKEKMTVTPGTQLPSFINSGFTVNLSNLEELQDQEIPFNFNLNLQGSENLSFLPVGNKTNISLQSTWSSPNFNGNFLPDNREVNDDGFAANWQVLQLNRNFPQSWEGIRYTETLNTSAFGVDLMLPLDDYQKSMRSVKYAIMTIVLTFLVFFLTETFQKRRIHPIQYTIVGLSLCLFYVLLISLSEHMDFNLAYFIATFATVMMISLYSVSVFKVKKYSLILVAVLTGIYSFLFVTLQLSDYALLMGSIGLSAIMGATMYFTRNIDWYGISLSSEKQEQLTC